MARTLNAEGAAGLFEPRDSFAMPLGPGQPGALLQGRTVHQRGEALAAVAHPDYRDELLAAAERASHGHAPFR